MFDEAPAADPAASAMTPGHFLARGATPPPPLVFASPHSGRAYPAEFLGVSRLDIDGLRRAEDAYVDELVAAVPQLGVPLVAARWGRAFIDLNRAPDEIDTSIIADPGAIGSVQQSERVRSGLGVLPRVTGPGLNIYRTRLTAAAVLSRIAAVHRPYHARIGALVEEAVAANGFALLVDCHSMPSLPMPHRARPHVVIGDAGGTAAPEAVVTFIESFFRRSGFRTARNAPYAGGYTTRRHADPQRGRFAVQIELDRALYMDPATLVRHEGFDAIARLYGELAAGLLAWLPQAYGPPAIAAE